MALAYLFDPNNQFQDRNGVNNVVGFLRVYYEGTDDRATTYKNFIGTLNPADIPIDNDGRAIVIVEDEKKYRLEVYARNGNLMWTQHPLCALVGGGGSFEQVQSDWNEKDPTSVSFIKNKPDLDNGRIHRLRPIADEVIGETSEHGGWVLDLESPNESAPGGYDRLTPQRLNEILNDGAFLAIETYTGSNYEVPLALQALVQVTNQNPLRISVDFIRQYVSGNILGFQRMKIYTPAGAESYLQMLDVGPQWRQDEEALATNGDGKDVTVTFSQASAVANIGSQEKLSVILGKIAKWFTAGFPIQNYGTKTITDPFVFVNNNGYTKIVNPADSQENSIQVRIDTVTDGEIPNVEIDIDNTAYNDSVVVKVRILVGDSYIEIPSTLDSDNYVRSGGILHISSHGMCWRGMTLNL